MPAAYQIAIDPELGLLAKDLSAAWAELPECAELGACTPATGSRTDFDVSFTDAATIALITFGASLAKDLTVELVKKAMIHADERQSRKRSLEVRVEHQRDASTGLPIITIRQGDDGKS